MSFQRSSTRKVFCPTCGALPGAPCITSTGKHVHGYHPSRRDVATTKEGGLVVKVRPQTKADKAEAKELGYNV